MKKLLILLVGVVCGMVSGCSSHRGGDPVGPGYGDPVMTYENVTNRLTYNVSGGGYAKLDQFNVAFDYPSIVFDVISANGHINGNEIQAQVYDANDNLIYTCYFNPNGSLTLHQTVDLKATPDHVIFDVTAGYYGQLQIVVTSYAH